jgi:hypothetical protein
LNYKPIIVKKEIFEKLFKFRQNYSDLKNGVSPYLVIIYFPILSFLIIAFIPLILTTERISLVSFRETGPIGDTIGGITGPIIGCIAAYITFLAFWAQFKSNKQQTKQFNKQDIDNKLNRFETKFFELLKIHRENVSQMKISDKAHDIECFIDMFIELHLSHSLTLESYNDSSLISKKLNYKPEDFMNIAYIGFFVGGDYYSDDVLKQLLSKYDKDFIKIYLDKVRENYHKEVKDGRILASANGDNFSFESTIFRGRIRLLSHYFRHLFQTVKFVDAQNDKDKDGNFIVDKKYYIKILRSQLSSHELLLLYYNSMSIYGQPWITSNYFKNYHILKNIPLSYIKFGLSPKIVLGKTDIDGKPMFEADEIKDREILYYT